MKILNYPWPQGIVTMCACGTQFSLEVGDGTVGAVGNDLQVDFFCPICGTEYQSTITKADLQALNIPSAMQSQEIKTCLSS